MENNENDVMEIDLVEVFFVLLHWFWLIVLCGILTGMVAFGVSKFLIPEEYQSTTTVFILNRQSENTVTYTDLQTGTQLTKDYAQLIRSRYVLESVIRDLDLDYTYNELASNVSVTTPSDTRMITITVTDYNPEQAQYIANAIRDVASVHIKNVTAIEAVNVVDVANLPIAPSAPSVMKWTLLGVLLGAFVCIAVIIIRYLMDDTIKSSEDIKNYLGLSTLALIPLAEERDEETKGEKASHHRNSTKKSGGKK